MKPLLSSTFHGTAVCLQLNQLMLTYAHGFTPKKKTYAHGPWYLYKMILISYTKRETSWPAVPLSSTLNCMYELACGALVINFKLYVLVYM